MLRIKLALRDYLTYFVKSYQGIIQQTDTYNTTNLLMEGRI